MSCLRGCMPCKLNLKRFNNTFDFEQQSAPRLHIVVKFALSYLSLAVASMCAEAWFAFMFKPALLLAW